MLGAGMMGAAIAYVCAKAGIEVVLKDVDQAAAERGKGYSEKLVAKGVERGKTTQEKGDALLALITPTDDPADGRGRRPRDRGRLRGPEGQGPGVRRDRAAPRRRRAAGLQHLDAADHRRWPRASRARPTSSGCTSSPPWTRCRCWRSSRASRPSDETLYRALDVAKQIKKTPIVVNDSRGFFTSRVIGTFINEGIAMLTEGVPAPSIEQASSQAGYPAPVLQLSRRAQPQAHAQDPQGGARRARPTGVRLGRAPVRGGHRPRCSTSTTGPASSRARASTSTRTASARGLWPGLREAFPPVDDPSPISLRDLEERMLFIEAIETVKCLDEGVIETVADANIGSIMGIGFPGWTGGVLQYINGYDGGLAGLRRPRARARRAVRRALRAARLAGRARRARRAVPRRREGRRHRVMHGRVASCSA